MGTELIAGTGPNPSSTGGRPRLRGARGRKAGVRVRPVVLSLTLRGGPPWITGDRTTGRVRGRGGSAVDKRQQSMVNKDGSAF